MSNDCNPEKENIETENLKKSLGKLKGAGVLCVSIHPKNGELMFLLAKERETEGWKQGSCKWTYFGGGANKNETGFQCGQREFQEECLGILEPLDEYIFEMILCTQYHPLFFKKKKEFPKETSLDAFSASKLLYSPTTTTHQMSPKITNPIATTPHHVKSVSCHIESPISPASFSKRSYSNDGDDKPVSNQEEFQKQFSSPYSDRSIDSSLSCSPLIGRSPSLGNVWKHEVLYVKYIPWQPFISFQFSQLRAKLLEFHYLTKKWNELTGEDIVKKKKCEKTILDLFQKHKGFTHSALQFEWNKETNQIEKFHVKDEFLEINEIKWWSFEELSNMIKRNGYYKGEKARASKLPLFYAVLKKLESMIKS